MKFGPYEIIERIAYGGMAEVYLARWVRLNAEKLVVIKRILPHLSQDPEFVRMFLDEVRISARLDHPNIVHIYDAGEVEGSPYLVMEYVRGVTLKECLEAEGALTPAEAVGIGIELAKALVYAHGQKDPIIHRDVTPQNILLGLEGYVKLADFGIARAQDRITHTQAGILKGKLSYMAPELLSGKDPSPASDQYSLGLLLFEMLAGERAYPRGSEAEIISRILAGAWQRDLEPYRALDPELRSLVERTLSLSPQDRFPDCRGVLRALQLYFSRKILDPWEELLSLRVQRVYARIKGGEGKPKGGILSAPFPASQPRAEATSPTLSGEPIPLAESTEVLPEPTRALERSSPPPSGREGHPQEGGNGEAQLAPQGETQGFTQRRPEKPLGKKVHPLSSRFLIRAGFGGGTLLLASLAIFGIATWWEGRDQRVSRSSYSSPPSSGTVPISEKIPVTTDGAKEKGGVGSTSPFPGKPWERKEEPETRRGENPFSGKGSSRTKRVDHTSSLPRKTNAPEPALASPLLDRNASPLPSSSPGYLSIQVIPWAFVAIGGEVGRTPILRKPLSPGTHEVRLRNPPLGWELVTTVTIQSERETRLIFHLQGGPP